ncbi:MAG: TlyA family RNA methyltransferase [Actinomycetia bacterium]|nr:TlyA family RNA methyltransferase [Actinomycetes bacterium]
MRAPSRVRLDEILVARGLADSRSAARGLIMAGSVSVSGKVIDKAGTPVAVDAEVTIKERPRFVSRAGEKLAHALAVLQVDVGGVSALDVGASTGGFVDCLLQGGAARVIALDVGRGQLDSGLRPDPRVVVLDRVNARYLTPDRLPYQPDFLTMDVSFISVEKIIPAVAACLAPRFSGLILVKPQFEAGPENVGKGGIVRDPAIHHKVLVKCARFMIEEAGLDVLGMCRSGLKGADGNQEFFIHTGRGGEEGFGTDRLEAIAEGVIAAGRMPVGGAAT